MYILDLNQIKSTGFKFDYASHLWQIFSTYEIFITPDCQFVVKNPDNEYETVPINQIRCMLRMDYLNKYPEGLKGKFLNEIIDRMFEGLFRATIALLDKPEMIQFRTPVEVKNNNKYKNDKINKMVEKKKISNAEIHAALDRLSNNKKRRELEAAARMLSMQK